MRDGVKLAMQVVISLVLLGVGVYVLLHTGSSDTLQKTAAGWVGVVVGYWLK